MAELMKEEREITSPIEIAETFNKYFSNVGDNLAEEIASPEHDPSFYLKQKIFFIAIFYRWYGVPISKQD